MQKCSQNCYQVVSLGEERKVVVLDGQNPPADHERTPGDEDADISPMFDQQFLVPGRIRIEILHSLNIFGIQELT